mmetsp:Transcript_74034/g.220909  ORF Transcript_74034/g.220909 Transcript_74034/m.220909 type:complete len:200 (+) Transcript_74034:2086-2685(+)
MGSPSALTCLQGRGWLAGQSTFSAPRPGARPAATPRWWRNRAQTSSRHCVRPAAPPAASLLPSHLTLIFPARARSASSGGSAASPASSRSEMQGTSLWAGPASTSSSPRATPPTLSWTPTGPSGRRSGARPRSGCAGTARGPWGARAPATRPTPPASAGPRGSPRRSSPACPPRPRWSPSSRWAPQCSRAPASGAAMGL